MLITLADMADPNRAYDIISVVGYSLAALFLVLSIALFFLYDIKKVYSFLTGKKREKGIDEMRKKQSERKDKTSAPSRKFRQSNASDKSNGNAVITPPPAVQTPPQPDYRENKPDTNNEPDDPQTDVIAAPDITPPLQEKSVDVALNSQQEDSKTELLKANEDDSDNETTLLSSQKSTGTFILVKNEILIHSDKVL